ncbi:FAD-dependent oxidoreductase, partial [Geminisphaera colitermitum]|uniref:FAD-dependent oxidoreductase n=1 Tax=Geminisphaera colitermitum TaxID=1148786 RepID=UPI000196552A
MKSSIPSASTPAPCDVLVTGGGPAGITAATQAARAGARTLLVEKSGILGGTTTLGAVNFPGLFHAWGRQIIAGIGWELVTAAVREAGDTLPDFSAWRGRRHWQQQIRVNIPIYAALADQMLVDAGAQILLHTMPAAVAYETETALWRVTLCGKEGLRTVHARVLVDCTGDANLVSLAGLPLTRHEQCQPGTLVMRAAGYDPAQLQRPADSPADTAVAAALDALEAAFLAAVERGDMRRSDFQSAHHPVRSFLHGRGGNSMHVPGVDGSTSEGRTAAELAARAAMLRIIRFFRTRPESAPLAAAAGLGGFYIEHCATECGIRETATIQGETCVTHDDYVTGRVWPDSICHSFYPIDLHNASGRGGIDTRYLTEGIFPTIPLGALLPRDSRQLIVAGRCACGDREANSAFRVQASAMAMGQSAGAAAALAAQRAQDLRDVPLDDLRALLKPHGAIVP